MTLQPRRDTIAAERQMAAARYLPEVVALSHPTRRDPLPVLDWQARPGGLLVGTRPWGDHGPGRPVYTAWRAALGLADLEPVNHESGWHLRAEAAHTGEVTVRIAIALAAGESVEVA